jgi:hypothetical protein
VKFIIILFSFFISVTIGLAQQKDSHAVQWIRYQNQLNFTPRIFWNNEIDNRRFINPDVQTQLIFHSRLHYKTGRWDYAGGLTLSWAYASRPENPVQHPVTEVRPVVEASYEIPFKKWFLQHRIRLDHRFIEEDKMETVFDDANYIMRFRYRLQARIPLHIDSKGIPLISLRLADEVMFNHRENIFDQNRIYATGEFVFNKKWSIEAGYIHIYQQRYTTDDFLQRHVLRISVLHKLFLYKAG